MDARSLERRLAEALLAEPAPPACAWLFGSRARGEARADSDVDIAVLLGAEPPATLSGGALSLEGRIEARLGAAVDLVVMDVAPVDLVHRVMRDGRLLLDRDPSLRVRFEGRARNAYFDLLPRLREYRGLLAHPLPWTDPDLLAKKLAFVETCVADLRRLADVAAIREDVKEQRFVAYTLQIAVQAALDAASHIVSSERLGEPATNRALFETLERHGWMPSWLVGTMRDVAGFRNVVVHGYLEVDPRVLEDVLANRLDDLLAFCDGVRVRLRD